MKKKFILAILAGFLLASGCRKDTKDVSGSTGESAETKTPVGTPKGAIVSKSIGTNGGELSTADGRIKIIIPAGALDSPKEISVQALTNELPEGIGDAYRLAPHGSQFAKHVTIVFKYDPADTTDRRPEFLDIAFQDDHGTWQMMTDTVLNKVQKTLSVTTSPFSDWG